MSSATFVTRQDVPVGYKTPYFPSLYWPIGNHEDYSLSFLYYTEDIWKFTIYWTLIMFCGFYGAAGAIASLSHRRTVGGFAIFLVYLAIGGVQGFISGTVVGFLLSVIYRAGVFSMSTWIPFVWAVVQILFNVSTSYSMMSAII